MLSLRPYQQRNLEELEQWFVDNPTGNPIINVATGGGKSVIIAELCRRAVLGYAERARILMLVPSKELVMQNYDKLKPYLSDLKVGIISASAGRKDVAFDKDIIIATVGSVAKNPGKLGRLDIILVDECHLINRTVSGQYRQLIYDCTKFNRNLCTIGMTATPYRGDGVWLTEGKERLFTDVATTASMRELLDHGYLSPLVVPTQQLAQISAEGVRMNGGDFVISDLAKRIDKDDLNQKIARQIVDHGRDRKKWLIYCVTIQHAEHMANCIKALGVDCAIVSSKTPKIERDRIIKRLKSGALRCVVNVACLTTGLDVPDLDMIALVRNTRSPVLYVQIAGRGTRIAEGKKDCLWLDFTDTTWTLGPVDQVKGRCEPKPQDNTRDAPFKICPNCGRQNATSTLKCKCGHDFPAPEPIINDGISQADILTSVKVKTLPVRRVVYESYTKKPGGLPTMKVSYFGNMGLIISEYICLDHHGIPKQKASQWVKDRFKHPLNYPAPQTVESAVALCMYFKEPTEITVKQVGDNWPEIVGFNWHDAS